MPTAERVLLDTHVLLWWKADRRRLSATARRHIDQADELFLSPLTFWEVGMLVEKQRIALDRPTTTWCHDVLAEGRTSLAPITAEVAVAAAELEHFHGDPVDRILTATAVAAGLAIVTKDTQMRNYARGAPFRAVW